MCRHMSVFDHQTDLESKGVLVANDTIRLKAIKKKYTLPHIQFSDRSI